MFFLSDTKNLLLKSKFYHYIALIVTKYPLIFTKVCYENVDRLHDVDVACALAIVDRC
jgi:hypothetical protein